MLPERSNDSNYVIVRKVAPQLECAPAGEGASLPELVRFALLVGDNAP